MKRFFVYFFAFSFFITLISCASENDVFPEVPLSTSTADVDLPNPISILTDAANNQIIVLNSNVDVFYNQGSLAVIFVDATDTDAPVLTATSIIAAPNYGTQIASNGTTLYIPFREALFDDPNEDILATYTIASGSITEGVQTQGGENPFGIVVRNNGDLLVVADNALHLYNSTLDRTASIDLTTATDADIEDTNAERVEDIVFDETNLRAFISNGNGNIFIVDLTSLELTHVIQGTLDTRGMATDGTYIYAVNGGDEPSLWVFDPNQVSATTSPPEAIDDSTLVIDVVDLGHDPQGLVIDTTGNRAYVANSDDRTISVIDLNLFEQIDFISLKYQDTGFKEGVDPFSLALGTFNSVPYVFVANFGSNTISVINTQTLNVVASFPD